MALPLYALTLFVSAFILFLVQPIIGKILLPKLGGTPQVWNTCMVFFQTVLLAGYAYTHNVSTRLNLRQQLMVHGVLLFLPLVMLLPVPFAMAYLGTDSETGRYLYSIREFVPDLGSNPIPSTLKVLFLYVALPFVVVATTAPLLQKWFAATGHPAAKDPYFLYGASNFGSMLSLILYPFVVEPYVSLGNQTYLYAWGFLVLVVLVLACAAMVWNPKEAPRVRTVAPEPRPEPPPAPAPTTTDPQTAIASGAPSMKTAPAKGVASSKLPTSRPEPSITMPSDEVTFGRRFRWVMLAAVPSSLMLGITTHITTDLSPIPFFWLLPLIMYLGSFILVFMRWPFLWTERLHEPGTSGGGMKPHQYMLYAHPFCLFFMIMVDVWNLTSSPAMISVAIVAHGLGFFATTMVCHGELARDRPTTKHLTEFYLWMSVGGMVGGMFNALIAPVIFTKLYELPLAIFAAALVRPRMFDVGALDNFLASILESPGEQAAPMKSGQRGPRVQTVTASESLVSKLDWAWPIAILLLCGLLVLLFGQRALRAESERDLVTTTLIVFGIPLGLACLGLARPLRFGLGVGAVLLMYHFNQNRFDDGTILSSRSYFGTISVKEYERRGPEGKGTLKYRQLVHGHINHGLNYVVPEKKLRGDVDRDLSRLATTYYHREGPVGRVMEKYNWFYHGPSNTYHADARMPASLVASFAADAVFSALPLTDLVTMWSEPPIATVGLGTGTMASYGRPYQHVHFYEIDNQIRRLNLALPSSQIMNYADYDKRKNEMAEQLQPKFNYLERALERGSTVQVLMGDARLRMALPYKNHYLDETERGGGPNNFYHMMVVDAFSSDAIPAHLLTEEAFRMYFEKLVPEGVLCVHTSNRFVDLPKVVGAVASKLTWNDYEVRLESVGDDRREDVVRAIQESTGLGANDAKTLVEGVPTSVQSHLSKKQATALERWLVDLGSRVTVKEHSHAYKARRGHDVNDDRDGKNLGHYTSEWVMVARKFEYMLNDEAEPAFNDRYMTAVKARHPERRPDPYWDLPSTDKKYVWTDDYYNLMSVVRFGK